VFRAPGGYVGIDLREYSGAYPRFTGMLYSMSNSDQTRAKGLTRMYVQTTNLPPLVHALIRVSVPR
jgi:hypothetical protein